MKIFNLPYLFYFSLFAVVVELGEAIRGACGVWKQDLALLTILVLLSLGPIKNKFFTIFSAITVFSFFSHAIMEQYVENEVCGVNADELNYLLVAVLFIAIGLFWDVRKK